MAQSQRQELEQVLELFVRSEPLDVDMMHQCFMLLLDPTKGMADKLLDFLKYQDASTLVNNVKHIGELLCYSLSHDKGTQLLQLKTILIKICEFHTYPQVQEVLLKLISALYDSEEGTTLRVIDTVGFEPLGQLIYKSSALANAAVNIICKLANKERINHLLNLITMRYYVLLYNDFNKVLVSLFEGEMRQKIYSGLTTVLSAYPASYPAVCSALCALCTTDENRRWFITAGMIEVLYSFIDTDITMDSVPSSPERKSKKKSGDHFNSHGHFHNHNQAASNGNGKSPNTPSRAIPIPGSPNTRKTTNLSSSPNLLSATFLHRSEHGSSGNLDDEALMQKNEHDVLLGCLNVTCKMAELEEAHKHIVKVGGLAVIVHSLKMDNRTLRNIAAIVLRSLAKMDDDNEVTLVQLGAIEALLPLLKTRSEPFLQNIMGAFRCVCFLKEHAERMARLGGVSAISEVLSEAVDDMTLLHALGMIRNLIDFPDISVMIDEAGVVLILIQKLRSISLYGEIDNVTMMLEIFSVCLTAEELGVMPALLFVEHGCVPILLKLLMKNNTACTAAIFEILLHIGSEKELCHSIICPELNILFENLDNVPADVADFFLDAYENIFLRSKLCLFLLENCQLPKMYGLMGKYPALEGFQEHLTEFLSENNFVNLKRCINSNNPYWVFCGTIAMAALGTRASWNGFEAKMVNILFEVLTSANLVFAVSSTQNKIATYRKLAAYSLGIMQQKIGVIPKAEQQKLPFLDNYDTLLNNPQYSDVRFVFPDEGEPIFAHRLLLVHRCEYFRDLFEHGFKEQHAKDITIGEASREIFYSLIQYLYTTKLNIPDVKYALELLELAERYRINEVKEAAIDYILDEIKAFYVKCTVDHTCTDSYFLTLHAFDNFTPQTQYTFADIEWIINVAHFGERIYHARLLENCCRVLPEILVHIINHSTIFPETETLHNTLSLVKQVLQKRLFPT